MSARYRPGVPDLVCLGSSTGGPGVLANILTGLGPSPPFTIVIAQHYDRRFMQSFCAWLDSVAPMPVSLARDGETPAAGRAYLADANHELSMHTDGVFRCLPVSDDAVLLPCVDQILATAVHWPARLAAAVLTGMGKDGAEGLCAVRAAGGHTIAQDEQSSIVYGMPRAAAKRGGVIEILPADEIAVALLRWAGAGPARRR